MWHGQRCKQSQKKKKKKKREPAALTTCQRCLLLTGKKKQKAFNLFLAKQEQRGGVTRGRTALS